jgi:hypothetical protein
MPTVNTENGEIEWSYDETSAELDRMGLPKGYPPESDFSEEEIQQSIESLDHYYLVKSVAEYAGEEFTAGQVKSWAAFVDTLGKDARIAVTGQGFKVTRDTSPDERRRSALSELATKRMTANRNMAKYALTRRYRDENTDAAGYKYDNGLTE